MKVSLRFKAPVGTRQKDKVIVLVDSSVALPFSALRELMAAEVAINTHSSVRVHLEVED